MKKILLFLIPFALFLSPAFSQSMMNSKVPATGIKTLVGANTNSSTFSNNGKPIILDLWATWCKPCIAELEAMNDEYADWKKETGVKIIAVSVDDARTMAKVQSFVKQKGWDFDFYLDPNQDFQHALQVANCPCTFIIDGNGKIAYIHNAYLEGDEKKLHAELVKIAAKK